LIDNDLTLYLTLDTESLLDTKRAVGCLIINGPIHYRVSAIIIIDNSQVAGGSC